MNKIRKIIKEKISEYIVANNLAPTYDCDAPNDFQDYVLSCGFSDEMVDIFVLSLMSEQQDLVNFLGKDLYCSKDFENYCKKVVDTAGN
ncbi:MAG: hypothetical protein IKC47_02480 [Clostridia bacterium]|nr:hypothetical protein [Clostridia bacterium]